VGAGRRKRLQRLDIKKLRLIATLGTELNLTRTADAAGAVDSFVAEFESLLVASMTSAG
jgi:hypothetical protein